MVTKTKRLTSVVLCTGRRPTITLLRPVQVTQIKRTGALHRILGTAIERQLLLTE